MSLKTKTILLTALTLKLIILLSIITNLETIATAKPTEKENYISSYLQNKTATITKTNLNPEIVSVSAVTTLKSKKIIYVEVAASHTTKVFVNKKELSAVSLMDAQRNPQSFEYDLWETTIKGKENKKYLHLKIKACNKNKCIRKNQKVKITRLKW